MAFDRSRRLEPEHEPDTEDLRAPHMFQRSSEAPPALEHVGSSAPLQDFRRELSAQRPMRTTRRLGSTRATARAWAGRLTGRADRRLLFALANATDALAHHHDVLIDRLTAQEGLTADMAAAFGEDLTRLRAEVTRLRSLAVHEESPHE